MTLDAIFFFMKSWKAFAVFFDVLLGRAYTSSLFNIYVQYNYSNDYTKDTKATLPRLNLITGQKKSSNWNFVLVKF